MILNLEDDLTTPRPLIAGDNKSDSVFCIRVLDDWRIYVRVLGKISRQDFSRALRNEAVDWKKVGIDGIIVECTYADDYDDWLHHR